MRGWATWYRTLLLAWIVIAAPGIVVAYSYSGGDFELPSNDFWDIASWFAAVGFLISPLLLWPMRKSPRNGGSP